MSQAPRWRRIKASAGSGKTYSLTGAYLSLLAGSAAEQGSGCVRANGDNYAWPEILGITFTNLAAAEMKDRVLTRLKEQALSDADKLEGWDRAGAIRAVNHLLRDPGAANIRTIDSLLHALVRMSALDLDLPPRFESEFNSDDFFAPLLEKQGQEALDENPALSAKFSKACRTLVAGMDSGFLAGNQISRGILTALRCLERFSQEQLTSLSPPEDLIRARDLAFAEFLESARGLNALLPRERPKFAKAFLEALARACDHPLRISEVKYDSKYFGKDCLADCRIGDKTVFPSDAAEEAFAGLSQASRKLERLDTLTGAALRLMPFLDPAKNLRNALGEYSREQARVLGEQMPWLAVRALREGGLGQAYCRLGSRLIHLLVDEFQDTSRLQWQALEPLIEEALSVGGSLTLVGDIKQAIYAWRGGDAELFDDVMKIKTLRDLAPNPELSSLDHNWRSRTEIINWNNAFFSLLEKEDLAKAFLLASLGAEHSPSETAEAARILSRDFRQCAQLPGETAAGPRPGGLARIDLLPPGEADPQLMDLLPKRVAELAEVYGLGQICILTRTNKQIEMAAQCLLQAGFPVVTEGSLYLAQQAPIIQAVALLEWLAAPEDDLALWTLLRGHDLLPDDFPLSGEQLANWGAARLRRDPVLPLGLALRRDFPELWQTWFAPLQDAAGLLTPYDAMREIMAKWRIMERNPKDAGFLLRFLEVLHRAEQYGHTDLPSFLDYWRNKGKEEKAPLPPGTEAISLMTIHRAKGLQFEVVLMPWLNFKLRHDNTPVCWIEGDLRLLCEPRKCMGDLYARLKTDAAREAVNLLYVGWTRAISELHAWLPQRAAAGKKTAGLDVGLKFLLDQLQCRTERGWQFGEQAPGNFAAPKRQEIPDLVLSGGQEAKDWKPMGWLPRLRIFRNSLEQLELSPKLRGTILHRCLELLNPGQTAPEDLSRLTAQVLRSYGLASAHDLAADFLQILVWYVQLPGCALWHRHGSPEHSLLDGAGNVFRVDRLVFLPKEYLALEYKSGRPAKLPDPDHLAQLGGYLRLLGAATGLPCAGKLIYLDERREIEVRP